MIIKDHKGAKLSLIAELYKVYIEITLSYTNVTSKNL
jgi:hypothetical protein